MPTEGPSAQLKFDVFGGVCDCIENQYVPSPKKIGSQKVVFKECAVRNFFRPSFRLDSLALLLVVP